MSRQQELPAGKELAFLQGIYNSAEIGICVTGSDRRFVLVNDAYCRTYGYPREELVGELFTKVLPEDLREYAARLHDTYLAGGDESPGEWRVLHKDGRIRNVLVTAGRVTTEDGGCFKVTTVQDVTELRAKESRLENLSQVVARTHHGVIFTDANGLLTWVNRGTERISGYTLAEMRGHKPGHLLQGEKSDPDTVAHMHRQLQAGEGFQVEIINYAKTGREYWTHIACSPVLDRDGQLEGFMALQTDITEQKHFQDRIEQLSFRDALTGLPNRRLVEDQLRYRMAGSQRGRLYSALLFLDLDNFKLINETLGHRQGDDLLMRVAQTLTETLGENDLAARLGGDEFVVVLGDLSRDPVEAAEQVERIAGEILSALARPFGQKQLEHRVTASMGALLFIGQELSVDELMQQSDIAMYQAKSAGKNTFAFFDPAVQSALLQRHRLEVDLREAIHTHQLVPFYQGQVDANGRLVSTELLIRWQHPSRGLLLPGEFIQIAEASGLIADLGNEVMRLAARQLSLWAKNKRTRDLSISVNISARHFEKPDFVEKVAAVLAEYPLRPAALKLEITESALAANLQTICARMTALLELGVSLSLDDFGTGYSSLAYLKRLPIGQVKIDQDFVRDLLIDDNDRGITEAIIALARTLKMDVVAEGVETAAQRDLLQELGCPVFQGYFFDRPAPLADFSQRYQLI
ncbi:putative bifunctional diguanylate cyclase/phosphodiesterase [Chromatocurvus halotolerans]|uniref:PAS domain S-box-containing protein/diguanylate cyclase (GGDEF)-like protein n=1 Tax=Chromatocurvus halotolerans TaxID=1132028 RepID=A0A4R2KRW8_9GAMM|nr:bifunctional diguanylate cyclase/phosphodiesterase [Chromatocurvus halotolerans]TCO77051.1 PAS domain S-box-containing protein/diguanylate cyclase (GGDEF)-like protein [Chromatocurvus halotolerans]